MSSYSVDCDLLRESLQTCRYEDSLKERRNKYLEIKGLLDEQVLEHEQAKNSQDAVQQQETEALLKTWQIQESAEKDAAEKDRLRQQDIYREMLNDNR